MKAWKNISIHRKLASFRSAFPHYDHSNVRDIERICSDVLEFSRPVSGGMVSINMDLSSILQTWCLFRSSDTSGL
jgi:hypothetical protein